ncbi:kinase-like protein [Obba rivulosa]|uniref:Kinase-like protein n=1 Tax=Obba rivulosa TaxID=1052685 RepID=A0A8E2DQW7_9APHY|nr:kinase-like protein [Obba rivulosa]
MDAAVKTAISAVSALHPGLEVLQTAYQYYKHVKYSKAKCKSLLTRAERMLQTISQAMSENRCDSSTSNLERLKRQVILVSLRGQVLIRNTHRNLESVRDLMMIQSKISFLKALLRSDDIDHALEEGRESLDDCFTCFQISAHAIVIQHQDEYEAARCDDALEIKQICLRILDMRNDRAVMEALDVKESQADEAMLAMQRELHQNIKESPERTVIEQGLACLQRSTGKAVPTNTPRWTITIYDINVDLETELGGGGFGVVVRGEWRGLEVAVKRMKSDSTKDLIREVEIWYNLHHDHIVPCYGASITADPPFIVLRYMQHGHLLQCLQSSVNVNRALLLYEVSLGMRYLHDENIIHGDIKAVNVLVDDGGKACLTDFGLSTRYRKGHSSKNTSDIGGTLRYMAPEAIETGRLTFATDVYAFATC